MRPRSVPLRVLCYAVNGLGLGHLTRLVAIARQLRRLAAVLEMPVEIVFLTSSEGDALAAVHRFATFKVPSKTLASACSLEPHRYRKIARQWIWNAVNLISPDLLLVDTFPAGSFHELPGVLDLGSRNVFIYREVRPEIAEQEAFRTALGGYDQIFRVQEWPDDDPNAGVPEELHDRVTAVGPVLLRSAGETFDRRAARELLGLPAEGRAVYVSTGGGGDQEAEAVLGEIAAAATGMPEVRFVIGAGLLYRGREWPAANVTWTRRPVLVECFRAFDAAITAGGFNTVWELMHCGVPCLFLPRPRGWDDQEARAARCVKAGAGRMLSSPDPDSVRSSLAALLQPEEQDRSAAAACSLIPRNHALDVAEEILSLVTDRGRIDQASELVDPAALFEAEREGIEEHDLLRAAGSIAARTTDGAAPEEAVQGALDLLRHVHAHGGNARQALSVLKKVERCAEPEQVSARAVEFWNMERRL